MKISSNNKNCILCDSNKLVKVLSLKKTPIADDFKKKYINKKIKNLFNLELVVCKNCNHTQLSEIVDPNYLFKKYKYKSSFSKSLINHFKIYSDEIIKNYNLTRNDLVLDIGSNDGSFLKFFKIKKIKVLGIDPAKQIAIDANNRNIQTIHGFLNNRVTNSIIKNFQKPKIITANNVFAHSKNLNEMTQCIKKLLDINGIFIFEVSYLMHILRYNLFDTIYHEHLSYHHVTPLINFFLKNDLKLFHVQSNSSKGGSIRCYVCHKNHKLKKSKELNYLISNERKFNNHFRYYFELLNSKLNSVENQLFNFGNKYELWGFGASATVTTFSFNFNLEKKLLGIFDDNKEKENLLLPSTKIKVFHSSKIYKFKPKYIMILSWIYSKQIIYNHLKFLKEGGVFIIPFPRIKLINSKNYKLLK